MRGRKPIPTGLKLISGNPGKRPINTFEPKPEGVLRVPPIWLTVGQKSIWRRAIANAPIGLLRLLDEDLLATWVLAADLHRGASAQIALHGTTQRTRAGLEVPSAHLKILDRASQLMLRASSELGFSPTSRSRITLAGDATRPNRFANNRIRRLLP